MKKSNSSLYIRRLEIVDNYNTPMFKIREVPVMTGISQALEFIKDKDGMKPVKGVLSKFIKYLDDDFKKMFKMEEEDGEQKH